MISKDQLNITNVYRILICMRPVIVQVYIGIRITQNVFVKFWMFYFYCCLWVHSDRRLFCMCEDFPPKKMTDCFLFEKDAVATPLRFARLYCSMTYNTLHTGSWKLYIYIYTKPCLYIQRGYTSRVKARGDKVCETITSISS